MEITGTAAEKNQCQHSPVWKTRCLSQSPERNSSPSMFSCQPDKEIFAHLFHPASVGSNQWIVEGSRNFCHFHGRSFLTSSLKKLVCCFLAASDEAATEVLGCVTATDHGQLIYSAGLFLVLGYTQPHGAQPLLANLF